MKYNDLSILLEQPVASSWIDDLTFIEDVEELEVADSSDSSEDDVIDVSEIDDDDIEDEGYEVITIGDEDFDEEEFGYAFDDDDEGLTLDFTFDSDDEDADQGGVLMTVKSGKTYYIPMPFEVYQKWLKASSKGKFWWSDVKGIYT